MDLKITRVDNTIDAHPIGMKMNIDVRKAARRPKNSKILLCYVSYDHKVTVYKFSSFDGGHFLS